MEEGGGFPGCLRAQFVPCGAPTPGDEQTAHQRRLNFLGSDSPALFAFPGEYEASASHIPNLGAYRAQAVLAPLSQQ